MTEFERTVFSEHEILALSESPAALTALASYHDGMAQEAHNANMLEPAEYHTRRAFDLRKEAERLGDCENGSCYGTEIIQPLTLQLPHLIDYVTRIGKLYERENIGFDKGWQMACARILAFLGARTFSSAPYLKLTNRLVYHSRVADLIHLALLNRGSINAKDLDSLDSCIQYLSTYLPQTDEDFQGKSVEVKAPDGTVAIQATSKTEGAFVPDCIPQELKLTDHTGRTVEFVRKDSIPVLESTTESVSSDSASIDSIAAICRVVSDIINKGIDAPDRGFSNDVIDMFEEIHSMALDAVRAEKILRDPYEPVGYMTLQEWKVLENNASSVITPPGATTGDEDIPFFVRPQDKEPEGWKLVPVGHPHIHYWIARYLDKLNVSNDDGMPHKSWNDAARTLTAVINAAPSYKESIKRLKDD